MCEICATSFKLLNDVDDTDSIYLYAEKKQLVFLVRGVVNKGDVRIPINNCPFCGRVL
jgi:hypothetical protein